MRRTGTVRGPPFVPAFLPIESSKLHSFVSMKLRRLTPTASCLFVICFYAQTAVIAQTIGTFTNPLIADGADPWVIYKDGNYFYTQTTGGEVTIRKSATITGLGFASATTVFTPSPPNNKD